MKSRETFSKYVYRLHEVVNTMLHKTSGLTYDDVRERYEHFRARCTVSNNKGLALDRRKTCKRIGSTMPLGSRASSAPLGSRASSAPLGSRASSAPLGSRASSAPLGSRASSAPLEKGCTEPIYGEKSKCILKIVPQKNKCETFQMDKKCIKQKIPDK